MEAAEGIFSGNFDHVADDDGDVEMGGPEEKRDVQSKKRPVVSVLHPKRYSMRHIDLYHQDS